MITSSTTFHSPFFSFYILGKVIEQRSNFRLSYISDIFWTVFDVIGRHLSLDLPHLTLGIFFQSLFSPSYRPPNRRDMSTSTSSSTSSNVRRRGPNVRGLRAMGEMNCAAGG